MKLLIPDIGLLFWMIISFGIVLFILAKFGFPVISKAVEKRNNHIKESLEAAQIAQDRLETLNDEAKAILEKAYAERSKILSEAQQTKSRIISEANNIAASQASELLTRARKEIEESKVKAINEIRDQVADLSVKIAEKVLNEKMQDEKQQHKVIERLLDEEIINLS